MATSILNKQHYRAFGLRIHSDIEFPELPAWENGMQETVADEVVVRFAYLADEWAEWTRQGGIWRADAKRFMFRIAGAAIFEIRDGAVIEVCPEPNADPDELRLFVLGSCMGAVLMQRGLLPLHGSAVVIDGRAYGIVGESGAGKSTLAAAFLQAGYRLASDDVIALKFEPGSDRPLVIPSYPQQKLWQQSLDGFGMPSDRLRPIFKRETKFAVPVNESYDDRPLPLSGLFVLSKTEEIEPILSSVSKLSSLPLLRSHTYRQFWLDRMGLTTWHFQMTASTAAHVDIYRLQRPSSGFTADKMVQKILNTILKEG
ncbi:aldolase [Cohnella sp. 56]|uniref:aldolase n=1 Tax=Cohnella sp. 56 TaxID=3113722 RepID=UPI0030E974B2